MSSPKRALGVRIIVCAVAVAGCQAVFGIHGATLSDGGLGQPCSEGNNNNSNDVSHCGDGNVCTMNQCRKPCASDVDCGSGERCLPSDANTNCNPTCLGGCVPSKGAPCNPQNPCGQMEMFIGAGMVGGCNKGDSNNCTCKGGTVCAQDGQCRASCSTNTMSGFMCPSGQSCFTDPTACRNQMGMGGDCGGACYGAPPHDTPISSDGGVVGGATTFYDGKLGNAFGIAIADNGVYFTIPTGSSPGVYGCQLDSCGTPQKTAMGTAPTFLAVSQHILAFTNQASLQIGVCTNLAPGSCAPQTFMDPTGNPNGVAIAPNTNVAWRDDPGMVFAANGADKLPIASISGPGGIAAIEQFVYWTASGHVFACATPLSTCNTPLMVANASAGNSITGNNARAFWVEPSGISSAPLGSMMVMQWVATNSVPNSVVYDAFTSSIFWTQADGSVKRTAAEQPQAMVTTVVSGGGSNPPGGGIAVSNTYVYWIAAGKIFRAPKG